MREMPERIWTNYAHVDNLQLDIEEDGEICYVRADLYAALEQENKELRAAVLKSYAHENEDGLDDFCCHCFEDVPNHKPDCIVARIQTAIVPTDVHCDESLVVDHVRNRIAALESRIADLLKEREDLAAGVQWQPIEQLESSPDGDYLFGHYGTLIYCRVLPRLEVLNNPRYLFTLFCPVPQPPKENENEF